MSIRRCLKAFGSVSVYLFSLATLDTAGSTLKTSQAEAEQASGIRVIRFVDDRLTVDVEGARLTDVLQEIAEQSGFTLEGYEANIDRITIRFDGRPLDEGLRLVLRNQSYALKHSLVAPRDGRSVESRLAVLRMFPSRGAGQNEGIDAAQGKDLVGDDTVDVPLLLTVLASGEDPVDREDAAWALGESGLAEVVAPLRQLGLADANEDVREAAIGALGAIGGDEAIHALTVALHDDSAELREEAITALAEVGGDAAAQALAVALHDDSTELRVEAIAALAEVGGAAAVESLAVALRDDDPDVREEAVEALGEIGGEGAVLLLKQAVLDADESVRDAAADALAELLDAPLMDKADNGGVPEATKGR
jgi:hypothetical protein